MSTAEAYDALAAWQAADKGRWVVIEIQAKNQVLVELCDRPDDKRVLGSIAGVSLSDAVTALIMQGRVER